MGVTALHNSRGAPHIAVSVNGVSGAMLCTVNVGVGIGLEARVETGE